MKARPTCSIKQEADTTTETTYQSKIMRNPLYGHVDSLQMGWEGYCHVSYKKRSRS